MSGFKDFDELNAAIPKALPIGGVVYEFPSRVSAKAGTLMLRMYRAASEAGPDADEAAVAATVGLTDDEARDLQSELLGDGMDRLVEDGKAAALAHVMKTLTVWHMAGQEAAEQAWNSLGPTTPPNRAARRSKATATSKKAAGSTAGTTSRPKPAGAASRGAASSKRGRS